MKSRVIRGRVACEHFHDRMIITFVDPQAVVTRRDKFAIQTPGGEFLDISPACERADGAVSVWYAPHPLLRHWLGWIERIDARRWRFRMEPFHVDVLQTFSQDPGSVDPQMLLPDWDVRGTGN